MRESHSSFCRRTAFTLIELMLSIAMVLILILGINKVFQYTSQAISAGQAISTATRDSRAAQTAFNNDLTNAATTDGPFFIIHSGQIYGFRNANDYATDKDGDASTIDLNGNGVEGETAVLGENVTPTTLDYRNHRVDVLTFFTRGSFPAQTGATQLIYPAVSSSEARVWYGFCKLPDSSYLNPGDIGYSGATKWHFPGLATTKTKATSGTAPAGSNPNTNPNNFFATDWVLGRVATLLLSSNPPVSTVTDYFPTPTWSTTSPPATLSPLAGSASHLFGGVTWVQSESRFDVAQTSISQYSALLTAWISAPANSAKNWWAASNDNFMLGPWGTASDTVFQCNPYLTATNTITATSAQLTPAKAARATPYFLKGCTQFCVEYAGDFVTQDNNPASATYGAVTDLVNTNSNNGDGIDFKIDPTTFQKTIRWYGFPRNATGLITTIGTGPLAKSYNIPGNTGAAYNYALKTMAAATKFLGKDVNDLTQTVPLRDVIASSGTAVTSLNTLLNTPGSQWMERTIPPAPTSGDEYAYGGVANNTDYLIAWGPDTDLAGIPRPKMIRITFTIDTNNSQIPDGQTYQYVYTLP